MISLVTGLTLSQRKRLHSQKVVRTNEIAKSSNSLTIVQFFYLYPGIHTFFEWVQRKMFRLHCVLAQEIRLGSTDYFSHERVGSGDFSLGGTCDLATTPESDNRCTDFMEGE